jgi:hypothetical protein
MTISTTSALVSTTAVSSLHYSSSNPSFLANLYKWHSLSTNPISITLQHFTNPSSLDIFFLHSECYFVYMFPSLPSSKNTYFLFSRKRRNRVKILKEQEDNSKTFFLFASTMKNHSIVWFFFVVFVSFGLFKTIVTAAKLCSFAFFCRNIFFCCRFFLFDDQREPSKKIFLWNHARSRWQRKYKFSIVKRSEELTNFAVCFRSLCDTMEGDQEKW